jgi:hypothetical protein
MVMIARNVPARPKARAMLSLESTKVDSVSDDLTSII